MMKNQCPCCGGPRLNQANVVSLTTVWFTCANCQHVWRSSFLEMAIGTAMGSVGLQPAPSPSANTVEVVKTPKAVAALMTKKSARTSMALEQSDVQVSNGLSHLEHALAATNSVSTDADDPDDGEAIVDAHLASWGTGSSASTPRVAAPPSPARTFDEQLEGLNAGLAKPAPVLQWHGDHEALLDEDEVNKPWPTQMHVQEEQVQDHEESLASRVEEDRPEMAPEFQPLSLPVVVEEKVFESPLTLSTDRMLKNVDSVCDAFRRLEQQFSGIERLCEELTAR